MRQTAFVGNTLYCCFSFLGGTFCPSIWLGVSQDTSHCRNEIIFGIFGWDINVWSTFLYILPTNFFDSTFSFLIKTAFILSFIFQFSKVHLIILHNICTRCIIRIPGQNLIKFHKFSIRLLLMLLCFVKFFPAIKVSEMKHKQSSTTASQVASKH